MTKTKKQQGILMLLKYRYAQKRLMLAAGLAINICCLPISISSAQAVEERARRADDFVDSIGVNTHLFYDSSVYYKRYKDLIKPKLVELGVRHIRDGCVRNLNGYMGRLKELHKLGGIRTTLVCDRREISPQAAVNLVKELGTNIVAAVQGPNEYDLGGDSNWVNNLRSYQQQLYRAIKADPATRNVTVLGPPVTSYQAFKALGDMSGFMDFGSMHNYISGRYPGNGGWGGGGYGSLPWHIKTAKQVSASKPLMTTETGYHSVVNTKNAHKGIPDDIAAKYMPRLLLEQYNLGIRRTFIYEFINCYNEPGSLYRNFGLLRNDGSQKPAYGALKNLIGLLKDPGPGFTPGHLNYNLGGDTANIHHTLLQKQNGKFYLILWKEVSGFNVDTKQRINVKSQRVSLTLNTKFSKATIYIPNDSASFKSSQTYPKQLALDIGDRPLVIELANN